MRMPEQAILLHYAAVCLFFQKRPFHKRYRLATIVVLRICHLTHTSERAILLHHAVVCFVFSKPTLS
jgi:hypothetical protein